MNIQEKILHKIKEERIEPISRWKFQISNYALWLVVIVLVFVATLGLSTIFNILREEEWDIYNNLGMSFMQYAIMVFPYVWLAFIITLALFALLILRLTKRGYRYMPGVVISIGLVISIVFGIIFHLLGAGSIIDEALTEEFSFYRSLPHHNITIWNHPKEGLIAGTIVSIINPKKLLLIDFNKKSWTIIESSTTWSGVNAQKIGMKIKVLGNDNGNGIFSADEIRPWQMLPPNERIIFPARNN